VKPESEDALLAQTEYGVTFPSAVAKGNVFGVQFHPEKSQKAGLKLLENFWNLVKEC
jgi:glutamine amidotransferase